MFQKYPTPVSSAHSSPFCVDLAFEQISEIIKIRMDWSQAKKH